MKNPANGHDCYLGLGSNLNQPTRQLRTAIKHLSTLPKTKYIRSASWYVSKAWGVTNQPDFINTVVHINTTLSPLALLQSIKTIEYRLMQRRPNAKWHARNIDIDILLYAKRQIRRPQLTVPHPLIGQRCFVLAPLLELRPDLCAHLRQQIHVHQSDHDCKHALCRLKTSKGS